MRLYQLISAGQCLSTVRLALEIVVVMALKVEIGLQLIPGLRGDGKVGLDSDSIKLLRVPWGRRRSEELWCSGTTAIIATTT